MEWLHLLVLRSYGHLEAGHYFRYDIAAEMAAAAQWTHQLIAASNPTGYEIKLSTVIFGSHEIIAISFQ